MEYESIYTCTLTLRVGGACKGHLRSSSGISDLQDLK